VIIVSVQGFFLLNHIGMQTLSEEERFSSISALFLKIGTYIYILEKYEIKDFPLIDSNNIFPETISKI